MKIPLIFLVLAIITATALAEGAEGNVGQYQLFSGTYEASTFGKSAAVLHGLFRIDTKTGTTWIYAAGIGRDGKYDEFWSKIAESPGSAGKPKIP